MTDTATPISGEKNYASKLSLSTMGCFPKAILGMAEDILKLPIARIYGIASDVRFQEDKDKGNGEGWTFFRGDFEGINLQKNTVVCSGKLFLPNGISEVMETALKAIKEKDKDAAVTFAFEIRVVRATNKAGYSYEAVALKSPQEEDALASLRTQVLNAPTMAEKEKARLAGGAPKVLEGQQAKKAS